MGELVVSWTKISEKRQQEFGDMAPGRRSQPFIADQGLTPEEVEVFKGLHDAVHHVECFGSRDVQEESMMTDKATPEQRHEVCPKCWDEQGDWIERND